MMKNKRIYDFDSRHIFLGVALLITLSITSTLAVIGLFEMQIKKPNALDYNAFMIFMQAWGIMPLVIGFYIAVFTRFNNTFRKITPPNSGKRSKENEK